MNRFATWSTLLSVGLLLALPACNKQGPESAADAVDVEASGEAVVAEPEALPPPPPLPEASPNAVAVGSALAGNGAVQAPKAGYATSETVYASVPTSGRAQGDTVTVYWTHEDGKVDKQEQKQLDAGVDYVNFAFSGADGMRAGEYNVQADVNNVPVGIADFTVQ